MKKNEKRRENVYSFIEMNGYASIPDLIKEFNVSKSTILRDLEILSDENKIERIHGGAKTFEDEKITMFNIRETINVATKRNIAKKAARQVKDNDIIFLDTGSTCYMLFKEIKANNVTVFTPNLAIISHERKENIAHLYALEGEVHYKNSSLGGNLTLENMKRISPDKIFFSVAGIDQDYDLQCENEIQMSTNFVIEQMRGKKILLLDSSKIGLNKPFKCGNLSNIDIFITDKNISQKDIEAIKNKVSDIIIYWQKSLKNNKIYM